MLPTLAITVVTPGAACTSLTVYEATLSASSGSVSLARTLPMAAVSSGTVLVSGDKVLGVSTTLMSMTEMAVPPWPSLTSTEKLSVPLYVGLGV